MIKNSLLSLQLLVGFVFTGFIFSGLIFSKQCSASEKLTVTSPDKQINVEFYLNNGVPKYRVLYQSTEIIAPSGLGFRFKELPNLQDNFVIKNKQHTLVNHSWKRVWGESTNVKNHYWELIVELEQQSQLKRQLNIVFRVYNDGIGFRYELPQQKNLTTFAITAEDTQFTFTHDVNTWSIPADYDSYEAIYKQGPLSTVLSANTPITLQTQSGIFASIHEAALTDYAGMTLIRSPDQPLQLISDLVPWPDGLKVKGETPFKTPWRTIQIAPTAAKLIESDLIVNLNEPNVIADTSWIKPMKYIGIWWGMHMREYTWQAGPKHGATTANVKRYIDFAKQHNIQGVLVEGWNQGWETWHTGLNIQNFTKAYDDFDLADIATYGIANNVALIGHHETGGNIPMYEAQMESAFKLYHEVGVHAIKTGYAGKMLPEGVHHHGQQMVNHYRDVVKLAAKYQIMINAHEPIKPTGIRRTYPNMMTREGGRGMEWNGWSEGNSPEHTVTLPFTRLLAGPMDYTPGIFNILFDPQGQYRVHSTLAKQLAMFVALYSPQQMAADMIENYVDLPAFEFIEKVPTNWHETKVLAGEIGDYISIARRNDKQWFIGSMTDEQPRQLTLKLDFLSAETTYVAKIYADTFETEFNDNPTAIFIGEYLVNKDDSLTAVLASGGGHAVHIYPAKNNQLNKIKKIENYNTAVAKNMAIFAQGSKYGEIKKVIHLAVNKNIKLLSEYDNEYSGGSENALVDGILGNSDYKTLWQGYRKKDLDVVIDLGKPTTVEAIEVGFLQSQLHSILLPTNVTFELSLDGKIFKTVGSMSFNTSEAMPDFQKEQFNSYFKKTTARYVRVHAKNLAELPAWHIRPGQEAFIFADEIQVH